MNKTILAVISSVLGISLLAAVPAFAQQGPGPNQQGSRPPMMRIWGHGGLEQGQGTEQENSNDNESGNEDGGNPPSPGMMGPLQQFFGRGIEMGRGEMLGRSTGGKVTAVSVPNFTLEIPANRIQATTTVNVVTNASTTFMLAKDTASVSDVAVGDFAEVIGRYASSTNTLTAVRVNLATSTPGKGLRPMMEIHGYSSTTPEQVQADITARLTNQFSGSVAPNVIKDIINSIFSSFGHFFGR